MVTAAVLGLPPVALAGLVAVFVLGGVVKGVTGVGLPLVLVPLTAQFLDVPAAVALLTVPMVATNVTQAMEGGHTLPAIRRMWPILVFVVLGLLVGVHLLLSIDRRRLSLILGISFLGLAALLLLMPRVRIGDRAARWAGPLVGFAAGVLGGMSAMFGPPMIAYLVGRGTDPDSFVKQMAIFAFTASLMMMLLALGARRRHVARRHADIGGGDRPIQAGMPLGRWLRRRSKPQWFRIAVLVVLALGELDMRRALPLDHHRRAASCARSPAVRSPFSVGEQARCSGSNAVGVIATRSGLVNNSSDENVP